jgi:putative ABC transport system permease protein
LCTALLIGSGLLLRSFQKVLDLDFGFQTDHVLAADIPLEGPRYRDPARRTAADRSIEQQLGSIPGISIAGAVSWLPLAGDEYQNPIFFPGAPLNPERIRNLPIAQIRFATSGYFRAAGIPLRAGRLYTDSAADTWSALVSVSAARRVWPGRDPLGQEFTIDESPKPRLWRVAGVVADVPQTELQKPAPLTVYLPLEHNPGMNLSFVLRTTLPLEAVAGSVRQAVRQVDPDIPVATIRPMRALVDASTAERRFQTLLLSTFAAIAILLAAVGIYGTVSCSVKRR